MKDFDMKDAPKVVGAAIAETIITGLCSLLMLFVPIRGINTFEFFKMIFSKIIDFNDTYVIVRSIYIVLVVFLALFSIFKVLLTKDKCRLDTGSPIQIANSPFYKLLGFSSLMSLFNGFIHIPWYFYYLLNNMDLYDNLTHVISVLSVFTITFIVVISCNTLGKMKKAIRHINELTMSFFVGNGVNTVRKQSKKSYASKRMDLDALIKYKKLYESGAITEEEYNTKKSELLDK